MPPLPLETALIAIGLLSILGVGLAGLVCAWLDHRASQARRFPHLSWDRTVARRAKQAKRARRVGV